MFCRTSQYALRALINLSAHSDGRPVSGPQIAREAKVPSKYLSKILCDLARAGVLESSPGRSGGFRLARPASSTRLIDVVTSFEQLSEGVCPFGNEACSETQPCPAHARWDDVVESVSRFLRLTTVEDISPRREDED